MPIVRVESSIHLTLEARVALLREIAACVVRNMDVHPRQIRASIEAVDASSALVGESLADPASPWLVAWVAILAGRHESKRTALIDELAGVLAAGFGAEEGAVRILIQEYPNVHWGIGRRTAAALGR